MKPVKNRVGLPARPLVRANKGFQGGIPTAEGMSALWHSKSLREIIQCNAWRTHVDELCVRAQCPQGHTPMCMKQARHVCMGQGVRVQSMLKDDYPFVFSMPVMCACVRACKACSRMITHLYDARPLCVPACVCAECAQRHFPICMMHARYVCLRACVQSVLKGIFPVMAGSAACQWLMLQYKMSKVKKFVDQPPNVVLRKIHNFYWEGERMCVAFGDEVDACPDSPTLLVSCTGAVYH
eukprot:1157619-Pelagomonas_calceolata.AAC.15